MTEGIASYLRIRVVNRSPLFWFTDGLENTAGMSTTWFRSIGTDATGTLTYWTTDNGAPSIASNAVTLGIAAQIHAGHADWTDGTALCRFVFNTSVNSLLVFHHSGGQLSGGTTGNGIYIQVSGAAVSIGKFLLSVATQTNTTASTQTNAVAYWMEIVASGTTYTANLYNDSAGAKGTLRATTSSTIADASVQSGDIALQALGATTVYGGAFANVCTVTGTGPDGTQGQTWTPLVTAGEPAFAWSKTSPYAGTYTASIYNANAAGNGSWQQTIRLFSGSNVTLSAQSKASAGTANVTAGGLTTGNAGAAYGAITAVGAITTNPTVNCNYSGAIGTAYFDALSILNPAYEITNDLPHLHTSSYTVQAMQPGNPSSTALGSFTVNLFPPGSEGFAAAKAVYDQLDYYQRIEMYESHDGASLGKLVFAGPITGIDRSYSTSSAFVLTGASDLQWANLSRPFPGETLSLNYGSGSSINASYRQSRNHFGTNELGWADSFSPFTSASYTSASLPSLSSGSWSGTTDDGLNVASCATGTGAVLISKVGASAQDQRGTYMVEVAGRLLPSADATNAGKLGVGISVSNADCNNCILVYVTAKKNGSHWDLNVTSTVYAFGALSASVATSSAFTTTEDPEGYIPVTISLHDINATGSAVVVNGKVVQGSGGGLTPPAAFPLIAGATNYPFMFSGAPATGTATTYISNLIQQVRYADDQNPGLAAFKSGTIGTPGHSLAAFADSSPTFLEVWSRAATREGWYWRYTPQAYVVGARTLGTVDLALDPGTDRGTNQSVVFSRISGNLIGFHVSANADQFASGTAASSLSGTDGGGIAPWRDVSTMTKYGVIDDQVLAVTAANFSEQRAASRQILSNKVALGSALSKSALVLRDPQTAGTWRELDRVTIHDPEMGQNYQLTRILAYTFTEGQATQSLVLDQFGADFIASPSDPGHTHFTIIPPPHKRLQQGIFQITNKFGNR